ncbi:unnamed protein product [Acanthoscelides obtectus]|uniref:Cilia- and flagella-associated protein 43 n=1 Tax=Acanthoscelides obtectus TaxID=200917 RepID=A0A9P0KD23_ACAOB|nr:unnamed protein product [Acanthoscelides obtectus]CAK1666910.1 Cilia- and flagella-associated protein 43 [Acanthoscelides obtectus]
MQKASNSLAEWIKVGHINDLCFIWKDVICYHSGCYIHFINLSNGEELIHSATNHNKNGDGIAAVTGHRTMYTFAYADNCNSPKVFIKAYPGCEVVCQFTDGVAEGYSSMTFSETSLLIALGNLPNFSITIWNWRSQEKFADLPNSGIFVDRQILRCSWGKPPNMLQLGRGGWKLCVWDLYTCCKKTVLAKHVVKIPDLKKTAKFSDILWTTEGAALVVDMRANIYNVDRDFAIERIIDAEIEGDYDPSLNWYKGGMTVSGPNKEIRHYKKSDTWVCDWTIPLPWGLKQVICNKFDFLVACTENDDLVKISNDGISFLKDDESNINEICLIYPVGKYVVALRHEKILCIYQVTSGELVGKIELSRRSICMVENPQFPYVAIGSEDGYIDLISLYNEQKPKKMATFHLCSKPIQKMYFFEQGMILVGANLDEGHFFIIEGFPGTQMKVVANVTAERQIVDFMLVASRACHRLFAIPVTANILAGNKILRFCVLAKEEINVKEYEIEGDALYHRLIPMSDSNRDRIFYALPCKGRTIHILETKRGDPMAKLAGDIKTGHQLRKFQLSINQHHAVTWSFDGFVIVRTADFEDCIGWCIPHHRYEGGILKAYVDPLETYVITLGRSNVMACTKLTDEPPDEDRRAELEELMKSQRYQLMFKRMTLGFLPDGRFEGKSWIEVEEILRIEKEKQLCRVERKRIMDEFLSIKRTLNDLVTQNLEGPENERIDLHEFYLDTSTYVQKRNKNIEDCRYMDRYLKALIVAQDKVSDHIIKTYWEPMDVKGRLLKGIFVNTMCNLYVLLPPDQESLKRLAWIEELRKIEKILATHDLFEPWLSMTKDGLDEDMGTQIKLPHDYARLTGDEYLEESGFAQLPIDTQVAVLGTVCMLYVDRSSAHYRQGFATTFYQFDLQERLCEQEIVKLKQKYNASFNATMELKEKEMDNIREKHARLRHIISEYNYFSKDKIYLDIVDPQWSQHEKPWQIMQVLDEELTITPYISPSEQAILDTKAAEDERIRLAMLADDFRERALMKMMNGVLEVKWEDELKKDVPKPKCMLEKDPAKFTEEDLRAVKDYEEKVAFLKSERERYKNILDGEFSKTAVSVRDSIRKFNQKVKETVEYKMVIDSGMNHESLRVNRSRDNEDCRISIYAKEAECVKTIKDTEAIMDRVKESISDLSKEMDECRVNLETLAAKEKILDKAFKRDIQEMSPIVQEFAIKLYKRRPKPLYRSANTGAVLYELARCIVSQERSLCLPPECTDFLSALDEMDEFAGLPPTIDEATWGIICKHRRLRIDYEVKLRAAQMHMSDGEATLATLQRRVQFKKEKIARVNVDIAKLRAEYLNNMHNTQMQIVLRRGLVEVPLTGSIDDFNDAIFVPRKEIEEINAKIREAGSKKLQTIMQNMAFRRTIMATEWEHQKERMEINDLIEQINDIKGVKFTREMQQYVKAKARGMKTEADSFEQEMEALTATYESTLKDKRDKHSKLVRQISAYKEHNASLDQAIQNINIDVCYLKIHQDHELESKERDMVGTRMNALLRRSSLIQQIQENHQEILVLQTELELLRLKTYPTFEYKVINTD